MIQFNVPICSIFKFFWDSRWNNEGEAMQLIITSQRQGMVAIFFYSRTCAQNKSCTAAILMMYANTQTHKLFWTYPKWQCITEKVCPTDKPWTEFDAANLSCMHPTKETSKSWDFDLVAGLCRDANIFGQNSFKPVETDVLDASIYGSSCYILAQNHTPMSQKFCFMQN